MVEFDELLITTGVDALVRLVKERNRIELADAAGTLNIPESTIEDWAGVLEEEGILKIEYRLTKIFLVWIAPTEEEMVEEREKLIKKKEATMDDIGELRKKIQPEIDNLEEMRKSFSDIYSKLSPKLTELDKKLEGIKTTRTAGPAKLDSYLSTVDSATSKLEEIDRELSGTRKELSSITEKIEQGPSKRSIERLDGLSGELEKMRKELATLRTKTEKFAKETPPDEEMPRVEEIREKLNDVIKEFKDARERSAKMRQDLIGLQEGKDILKIIGDSMKDYDKKIASMRGDVTALSKQANELKEKSEKLADKITKDKDTLEGFSDSMNVAREILNRFPAQKGITQELEKIQKTEKSVEERIKALKKLLEVAGGAGMVSAEFGELSSQMDERLGQLSSEISDLQSSLEEQKGTFLTFQTIKEKLTPSIDKYGKEIQLLSDQLKKMKVEMGAQTKNLEDEAGKLAQQLEKGKIKEVMDLANELERKRKMLEEIKASIDSLSSTSENLNRKLAVLSRQAGILELRGGAGAPAVEVSEEKKAEIKQQIALTRDEEAEFKKKREELRELIKRLWEEGKK